MTKYRTRILIASSAALLTGLSACSSSSSSGKATADTNSSTNSSSSTTSGTASGVATFVKKLETRPSTVAIGQKIGKPIPTGKTIYTIDCGLSACTILGAEIKVAAAKLGWAVKDIKTDASPQQITGAWQQVITDKPDFAVIEGTPLAEIKTYVDKAAANGTVVVANAMAESDPHIIANTENATDLGVTADAMAAWVGNDAKVSGDTNAGAVFVNVPDFTLFKPMTVTFKSSLAKYCPGCTASQLDIGLSSLGNSVSLITSYLRAHPSVKYVVYSGANIFDNVTPALRAAGLKVKILGGTPSDTSLSQVRSGTLDATIAYPYTEVSYALVDTMARSAAGVTKTQPPAKYAAPLWLLTKNNVPSTNSFPIVQSSASQYAAVWGKS